MKPWHLGHGLLIAISVNSVNSIYYILWSVHYQNMRAYYKRFYALFFSNIYLYKHSTLSGS